MTTTCNTTFTIRPLLCRVWLATLLLATISQVPEAEAWVVPDPVVHFGIGAVAGGVGAFAAYPFDYIKSQLQTEYGKETWGNDGIQALKDTLKEHGPFHLYKGLTVQLVGVAPEKAIKLGVNDIIASAFMSNYGIFPLWGQVVSGSVAGACQVVASSPLEVLKVGLQTSDRNLATVWTEIGGIRGLFRGCGACMMRDIVFTAICFPFYHYLVQDLSWPTFFAGALSGSVSSFTATPPDVIKTRILSQPPARLEHTGTSLPESQGGVAATALYSSMSMASEAVLSVTGTMTNSSTYVEPTAATYAATATTMGEESSMGFYQSQQFVNDVTDNPWEMLQRVIETEGSSALWSGSGERAIGAIPRFGTTLAMHDLLEQLAHQAGWLSAHGVS